MSGIYDYTVKSPDGKLVNLSEYRGKPLLIVNTASKCGFTPQFSGLEALYRRYRRRGLHVLGFPSDQFNQELDCEIDVVSFCRVRYGVSFHMFQKVVLNGPDTHPLFDFLKSEARGIFFSKAIKWNFTKFLVDRNGQVRARFAPMTRPYEIDRAVRSVL